MGVSPLGFPGRGYGLEDLCVVGFGREFGGIGTGEPAKGTRQGRDGTHRPSRNG